MILGKKPAEGMELIELRRQKRKRRKARRKLVLLIMLVLTICIGILFTPLFNLSEIEIEGNLKLTAEEIIKASGLVMGENIFKFKLKESGEKISKIPYVNSIRVERKLPGKIRIEITESIPMAYIPYNDKLIVTDYEGKVLEVKTEKINYAVPILYDFNLKSFSLGEKINEKDSEKLKKTLEITKNLYNNNLIEKVRSINSVDGEYFLNISEKLKITIGDGSDLSAKLVMLLEVLKKIPADAGGLIDARNADRVYHRS